MQQTLSTNPFLNTIYWLNISQSHVQANINIPASNVTQIQPKEMSTQTTVGITSEQQLEIDQQVASRLQEMEIAKARWKHSPHPQKQDSSCQYDPRDIDRADMHQPRQHSARLKEPAYVGSTSQTQQRHRNMDSRMTR